MNYVCANDNGRCTYTKLMCRILSTTVFVFVDVSGGFSKAGVRQLEGVVVTQLRDSITYSESLVDGFIFPQSLANPCILLHMENRVNEKLIMMLVLEGKIKHSEPVALSDYFERLVVLLNNYVMYDMDGQWKLPIKDGKIEAMSLSNGSARKVIENIELWFDLAFERHPSECKCRKFSKLVLQKSYRLVWRTLEK